MTLSKLLREQGVQAVPHGFRSSFRDWAAEETNHPRDVVEAPLAHQVKDKVESAYARSTLFERRRRLMAEAYLTGATSSANRSGRLLKSLEPTGDEMRG